MGIDGYSWIHKCIYNIGHDLVVLNDKSSYMNKMAVKFDQLKQFDIRIILVFDGDRLPSKSGTEEKREENRNEKREMANLLLQQGNM